MYRVIILTKVDLEGTFEAVTDYTTSADALAYIANQQASVVGQTVNSNGHSIEYAYFGVYYPEPEDFPSTPVDELNPSYIYVRNPWAAPAFPADNVG